MLYSFECPSEQHLVVQLGRIYCFDSSETWLGAYPVAISVSLDPVNVDPVTGFTDGAFLGWGVALAMVAAWSIHVLRRAI